MRQLALPEEGTLTVHLVEPSNRKSLMRYHIPDPPPLPETLPGTIPSSGPDVVPDEGPLEEPVEDTAKQEPEEDLPGSDESDVADMCNWCPSTRHDTH